MKIEPFPGTLTMQMVERRFVTKTGREGCQHVKAWVLTDEQQEWLCRWFPVVDNPRLMKMSGMTHNALHRFARELGLSKSEDGLHRIMKAQARQVKRMLERNGYYDSLRGRAPSEATREGTRRMWQEVRDGKREHPAVKMKRTNPHKYRQWMKRKSEERKETLRKETLRMKWGLPRQTKLKAVVMCPYTTSQTSHRYNALRRGYILADDCSEGSGYRYVIYYDNETRRAPQFEQNLMRDGFRLEEWKD